MAEQTRFDLSQDQMPTAWFNIMPSIVQAGMQPLPPLHPGTHEPVGPADLAPLFPESLILQEVSTEPWIDIPGEVLDIYRLWRPSPLHRATRLEQALQTPARIYFKYEGVSPAGSHKPNTAVAQAYYNKEAGTKRIATETGAGQWGSALAMACAFFGIDCQVFMVKASFQQKPYRRIFMETFGAEVTSSPSPRTQAGKAALEANPEHTGFARPRHQRGGRGGRHQRRFDQVRVGVRAEPCAAAPDDHRARGQGPDGARRRHTRRHDRLRGRRLELRRARVSVHGRSSLGCEAGHAVPRHRAGGVPDPDQGEVRLRLRRHGGHVPDRADVHARAHVPAGAGARGRVALPRRLSVALAARPRGTHGGDRLHAEPGVRGRDPVRQDPGHHRRARVLATRSRVRSTRRSPPARPTRSA